MPRTYPRILRVANVDMQAMAGMELSSCLSGCFCTFVNDGLVCFVQMGVGQQPSPGHPTIRFVWTYFLQLHGGILMINLHEVIHLQVVLSCCSTSSSVTVYPASLFDGMMDIFRIRPT